MTDNLPKILIIAGSDSSAGAGLQADIKTASAHKVYASTVITSVTSQNTLGVQAVYDIPLETVKSQIDSVMEDVGATHIKLGMLSNSEIITAVAEELSKYPELKVVADTVMVAKGGHQLISEDAINILKNKILDKAFIITPNIPEAEVLSGLKIKDKKDMIKAAEIIAREIGAEYILIKGGHLDSAKLTDILFYKKENSVILEIDSNKIDTKNTHGTGCTYASAIASNLAKGKDVIDAVSDAHKYVENAIKKAPKNIGKGHGPVYHWL